MNCMSPSNLANLLMLSTVSSCTDFIFLLQQKYDRGKSYRISSASPMKSVRYRSTECVYRSQAVGTSSSFLSPGNYVSWGQEYEYLACCFYFYKKEMGKKFQSQEYFSSCYRKPSASELVLNRSTAIEKIPSSTQHGKVENEIGTERRPVSNYPIDGDGRL